MAYKFPTFVPENQSLSNFLELIKVAFTATGVTDESKKVSLILTHNNKASLYIGQHIIDV